MITHIDENGNAVMVDVSGKAETFRTAAAQGEIHVGPEAFAAIRDGAVKKGDVLGVAQVAGIMAKCAVTFTLREEDHTIIAECTASTTGQTGVEVEALTGVSGALLTIYDMCKAIDKSMVLGQIHLVQKTGGKSGDFTFPLQKIE